MDFVKIVYRYRNRYLNSEDLVESIENISKEELNDIDLNELEIIKNDVNDIIKNTKITLDDEEIRRRKETDKIINILEKILNNPNNDDNDALDRIKEKYNSFKEQEMIKRDSGNRYVELDNYLENCDLFKKYYNNMSDEELLNFITNYIKMPNPFKLSKEKLDDLIDIGLKQNNKEKLWRLAFNYAEYGIDTSKIEDYYINERDDYYLIELISAIKEYLNVDRIMDKVLDTNDDKFIHACANYATKLELFTWDELKEKLKQHQNNKM